MSDYGRSWQEIKDIREQLRRLAPFMNANSLGEARDSVAKLKDRLDGLLFDWGQIERQLANVDARQLSELAAIFTRSTCALCGTTNGVHRSLTREDGAVVSCRGGDLAWLVAEVRRLYAGANT